MLNSPATALQFRLVCKEGLGGPETPFCEKWSKKVNFLHQPTSYFQLHLSSQNSYKHTHTHNRFTALLEFVPDYPGEQVPER